MSVMRQQSRLPAEYRNPYALLNQARAIEIEAVMRDIECEVGVRLDAVRRATLAAVLERFAERWPCVSGSVVPW